jgi:hypothetical protein
MHEVLGVEEMRDAVLIVVILEDPCELANDLLVCVFLHGELPFGKWYRRGLSASMPATTEFVSNRPYIRHVAAFEKWLSA